MNILKRFFHKTTGKEKTTIRSAIISNKKPTAIKSTIFHGGCINCTMQQEKGLGYCTGCMYFECNWDLPDLNDEHARIKAQENIMRGIAKSMASKN